MLGRLVRDVVEEAPDPARAREQTTKFVLECVFAMFAEDTDLVPEHLFTNAVREAEDSERSRFRLLSARLYRHRRPCNHVAHQVEASLRRKGLDIDRQVKHGLTARVECVAQARRQVLTHTKAGAEQVSLIPL